MTEGMEGRRAGKFMVSSPSSHQASILENGIVLWSITRGPWAGVGGIMAKYVLAANLLGREHKGSRKSVNPLRKIPVYIQR